MVVETGPLFRYARAGFSFEVYPNRVEVLDKSGLTGRFAPKRETIPARTIAGVDVKGITRKLTITTNDGRAHEFNLGGQHEDARQAILGTL
jgi:hypothetical protein